MEFIKNQELLEEVYQNIRSHVDGDREGIHLSDCIYCIRKAYFRKIGIAPPAPPDVCLLWVTGFAFQNYLFPYDKEETIVLNGISCTPDILMRGVEVKSTRQSMGKFDPNTQEAWKRQILGYMKVLGVTEFNLTVMFVCGDYKPPFPDLDCWHCIATQEEIDENWNMVLSNAYELGCALQCGMPPQPTCMDWEWKYCECAELCPDTYCWRMRNLGKGGK